MRAIKHSCRCWLIQICLIWLIRHDCLMAHEIHYLLIWFRPISLLINLNSSFKPFNCDWRHSIKLFGWIDELNRLIKWNYWPKYNNSTLFSNKRFIRFHSSHSFIKPEMMGGLARGIHFLAWINEWWLELRTELKRNWIPQSTNQN